jgi:hypothetical protein
MRNRLHERCDQLGEASREQGAMETVALGFHFEDLPVGRRFQT